MNQERNPDFEADLSTFLDDPEGLSPERRTEIEAWLDGHVDEAVETMAMHEPSEDFDRALFARLDEIDQKNESSAEAPPWLIALKDFFTMPRLTLAAGAAMAGFALFVSRTGSEDPLKDPDLQEIAENLELYRNLDIIENLDVLDDLELIENLDLEETG